MTRINRFFGIAVLVQARLVLTAATMFVRSLQTNRAGIIAAEKEFITVNTAQLYQRTLDSAVLLVENAVSRIAPSPALVLDG
ncbi:MAG: hypothetical protein EA427_00380, partial [Spirochaetaceae bacterium]